MLTASEVAVTATVWALTAVGGFFGLRAALRRRKGRASQLEQRHVNMAAMGHRGKGEERMGNCGCGHAAGAGPYAEGRELVEFVSQAHGGALRDRPIPDGGLAATCQGCGAGFTLATFVGSCPECGGVHAVSPPRCSDPTNIQYAGAGYP